MSKLQFVSIIVTAASSFVLVILAWMQSNVRMSRIESLLDAGANRQAADMKEIRERITSDVQDLQGQWSADMKEIRERLTIIDNHLMTFYTVTGRLEGRIDELSRR